MAQRNGGDRIRATAQADETAKRVHLLLTEGTWGVCKKMPAKEARQLAEALNQAADDVAPPRKPKGK